MDDDTGLVLSLLMGICFIPIYGIILSVIYDALGWIGLFIFISINLFAISYVWCVEKWRMNNDGR